MDVPLDIKQIFREYTNEIDDALEQFFDDLPQYHMYKHMAYFMGFANESLERERGYGGKRARSALALMLGDWYGVREAMKPVALSLELFHNFTLIHDDIVDADTHRRGRATVWKQWGTPHAINDGDAQLILAYRIVTNSPGNPKQKLAVLSFLSKQYVQVIEGQHLDFTLTDLPLSDARVTEASYFEMIERKTADLIAAATKAPGMLASLGEDEQAQLFRYGHELGIAYQLCDDVVSIWGNTDMTGKRAHGDVIERKKTYPILYAYDTLADTDQTALFDLYTKAGELSETDVAIVITLLEKVSAHGQSRKLIDQHAQNAKDAASTLSLSDSQKETLVGIVDALLPKVTRG